nr:hypothetical protein [Prolixibacteraceae bacterium]
MKVFLIFTLVLFLSIFNFASAQNEPILIEAEDGTLGTDFTSSNIGDITYITCNSDGAGDSPASADRVVTYTIEFAEAGIYDLYARLRVGGAAANDDSFFYGSSFGEKNVTDENDWITINN